MPEKLDFIGGSLVHIILGALILWVGQTTFHHSGRLATVDEKFTGVEQQFADVDGNYQSLRSWLEKVVNSMKDNNRYAFTDDDAEKFAEQLRKLDLIVEKVERRLTDRVTAAEIKLASLETRGPESRELAALQVEVAQLRAMVAQPRVAADYNYPTYQAQATEAQYQPAPRVARQVPVYLPPVNGRR